MDGTLVDSMRYWDRLSPEYLISRGINEDTDELMERIKTMTMPEACAVLKQTFDLPETPQEIAATENLDDALFSDAAKAKYPDLDERVAVFRDVGVPAPLAVQRVADMLHHRHELHVMAAERLQEQVDFAPSAFAGVIHRAHGVELDAFALQYL